MLSINTNTPFFMIEQQPSSPTFSTYSWVAEKSSHEIKHILKSTFNSLFEKERDLKLAAEVGKTLLESNTVLEQKYMTLQQELELRQDKSTKHYQNRLQHTENVISSLETENAELIKKYEATLASQEKLSRQNSYNQEKLTFQVNQLYQSLEQAYEKIETNESYRHDYLKKLIVNKEEHSNAIEDDHAYHVLSHKIDDMMHQNQQLYRDKHQIQQQFSDTMHRLKQLQSQFLQMQPTQDQFQILENKFNSQEKHIYQLTGLLEEYRENLLNGCHQQPSLITGHTSSSSEDDEEDYCYQPQQNLYSELQSAFQKQEQHCPSIQYDILVEENQIIVSSPKRKARKRRIPPKSLYPNLKIDGSLITPMYRRRIITVSKTNKVKSTFYSMLEIPFNSFYLVWRFFRFFFVIQLAMVIHLFTSCFKK